MIKREVVVYHIGPTCIQCEMTKKQFVRFAVPFTEVDLRDDSAAVEKFKQMGYLTAPIVTVGGDQVWSGFKPERIGLVAKLHHNV